MATATGGNNINYNFSLHVRLLAFFFSSDKGTRRGQGKAGCWGCGLCRYVVDGNAMLKDYSSTTSFPDPRSFMYWIETLAVKLFCCPSLRTQSGVARQFLPTHSFGRIVVLSLLCLSC